MAFALSLFFYIKNVELQEKKATVRLGTAIEEKVTKKSCQSKKVGCNWKKWLFVRLCFTETMRVTAPKHGNEAKRNPAKRIECEHCAFRKMFSPFRNANRTALVPCSTRSGPVSPSPCQPSRGTLFCATEGFFCGGGVMTCSGWNAFQMLRFAVQTQKTLKDSVFFLAFPLRQASVGRCWNATLFYGKAKKCCSCLLRIENMTSVLASWFFFPRFFFRSRLKQLWKSKFHEWSLPALHPELKSVFTTSRLWKTKAKWPWEIMRWTKKWLRPGHIFFNAGKA